MYSKSLDPEKIIMSVRSSLDKKIGIPTKAKIFVKVISSDLAASS